MKKIIANFSEEQKLWRSGYKFVIGIDEVGRGSFAGPVVAAGIVFLEKGDEISSLGINDSKLLKPRERESLEKEIKSRTSLYAISSVDVSTINRIGIGRATTMAFRKAIRLLLNCSIAKIVKNNNGTMKQSNNCFVLIDGFHVKYLKGIGLKNQKAIIKGDQKSISIAAASILAKVYRDRLMKKLHRKYPMYRFSKNKGYGTLEHREAIGQYGLCSQHRTSFRLQKFLL